MRTSHVGWLALLLIPVYGLADEETLPKFLAGDANTKAQIRCIGSDTMGDLMVKWSQGLKQHIPGITFSLESKGSATAVPGLLGGRAGKYPVSSIGHSIRIKDREMEEFEAKRGYPLTIVTVAVQKTQDFPDGRFFYFFIDLPPRARLKPELAEFVGFVLSRDGQAIVSQSGFEPINAKTASDELNKLRRDP